MSEFKYTWPTGIAEFVLIRMKQWSTGYSTSPGAKMVNPKKVASLDGDEDKAKVVCTRYKHNIEFSLNEIRWVRDILVHEDSRTGPAKAFDQAYKRHEDYVKKNPTFTARYGQWYDLKKAEVDYIFNILQRIKFGRPTPAQEAAKKNDIAGGDW